MKLYEIYSNGLKKGLTIESIICFKSIMGEKKINDGVEALTRKSQALFFQII